MSIMVRMRKAIRNLGHRNRLLILFGISLVLSYRACVADDTMLGSSMPLNMQYDVMYGGYRIGEIDLTQSRPYNYEKQKVTDLECRLEANAIIEHSGFYRSIVTDDYTVLYLKADVTTMGKRRIDEYNFDYDAGKIFLKTDLPGENKSAQYSFDIGKQDKQYFDMISMIFRLRDGLDTLRAPFIIPVFVYSRPDSIIIDSITDDTVIVSDGAEVSAKHIKGRIPFTTFPGAGERFDIFISSDDMRIPLKASLQMALGRIEILPKRHE